MKKGAKIYVQYGKSKSDKYGRYLGDIYEDKDHLDELNKAQDYAEKNKLNIWSKSGYVTNKGYNPDVFK